MFIVYSTVVSLETKNKESNEFMYLCITCVGIVEKK